MKRRQTFLLLFLALGLGAFGCSSGTEGLPSSGTEGLSLEPAPTMKTPPPANPQDLKELVRGNSKFALNLYSRLARNTEGNMGVTAVPQAVML